MGLLSIGTWYGHYEATKSSTKISATGLAGLRAAFGAGGFGGGFGGFGGGRASASTGTTSTGTTSSTTGGFGGFGGTRITGVIKSVNGSTVTITLDDPTQASSLISGDVARVTDTGATAPAGSTTSSNNTTVQAPAPAASGAPAPAASSGGARRGGLFSNAKMQACLTKAGITLTQGSRPDFQDPKTAAALQSCFAQLGITPGGGFGAGAPGGGAPAPVPTASN